MRNVIDVAGAFREQWRVTKPGGRVVVLESSPPKDNLLKPFIRIHLNTVIPTLGRLITGEADAYRYLPDSTQGFQGPDELAATMRAAGFVDVGYRLFMFGRLPFTSGRRFSWIRNRVSQKKLGFYVCKPTVIKSPAAPGYNAAHENAGPVSACAVGCLRPGG